MKLTEIEQRIQALEDWLKNNQDSIQYQIVLQDKTELEKLKEQHYAKTL